MKLKARIAIPITFAGCALAIACSSTSPPGTPAPTCTDGGSGGPVSGATDTHCAGVTPQPIDQASCNIVDAGAPGMTENDAGSPDGGSADGGTAGIDAAAPDLDAGAPMNTQCGANGTDYGDTMFGGEGDDDDCKYHVTWSVAPICENDGTYFTVTASYLTMNGAPLTSAYPFAELCLDNHHPAPPVDSPAPQGKQTVVEGPPGTYRVGPVQFDAPGQWTVRFHFNELCYDVLHTSPHGHAAFFVNVP